MTQENPVAAELLSAMRRFGQSVCIITSRRPEGRVGIVATAVTSLSLDPPSLLISVNRSSSIHPIISARSRFCVNLLAVRHHDLARFCSTASSGEARFSRGDWAEHANGLPYLLDAQAAIFCEHDGEFHYGTHTIFVGKVCQAIICKDVEPLLYINGQYSSIGSVLQRICDAVP